MNYSKKTLLELKDLCKNKKLKGYSQLNKKELIKFIKTKVNRKKQKGGDEGYLFKTNNELKEAVTNWVDNREKALEKYGEINTWNTSKITDMRHLFYAPIIYLENLSENQKKENIIYKKSIFNDDISNWDVSNVTNMERMFENCSKFNQPLNKWDVSNVEKMLKMFSNCSSFNQPLNEWDVSNVKSMSYMFENCTEFNQNISDWSNKVRYDIGIKKIFENCNQLNNKYKPKFYDINSKNYIYIEPKDLDNSGLYKKTTNTANTKKTTTISSCNDNIYKIIMNTGSNLRDFVFLKEDKNSNKNSNKKINHTKVQKGINAGGLSRIVYDIFLRSYIRRFFDNTDNGLILRTNKNLNVNNFKMKGRYDNLNLATIKLIQLAKKANVKIILAIEDELLEFMKQNKENTKNLININSKNKYVMFENKNLTLKNVSNKYLKNKYFKKYGYTEEQLNAINGWNNITSHMIPNNSKRNKDFEFETNESKWSNNNKKEIYLRMYLKKIGFTNLKQFKNMYKWFIYFWLDNEDLFINKISFKKEDFMNRIIIVEQKEDVLGNLNILYQKSQETDKISKIINNPKYINLKVLLDYINKSDENREKFNRWVTGSAYSTSVIKIYINPDVRDLWDVSTCSAAIQVKSSKNNIKNINYNTLYSILLSLINSDLEKPKLTTE